MDMKAWIAEQISQTTKKAMPVLSFPSVSLLGITVKELIADPKLQADGMCLVAGRVDSAASVSMMDLSVEAEAFGSKIKLSDNEVPTVIDTILTDEDDAKALVIPEVGAGRTGRYIEAIKLACGRITDRPVFAGVIGPFSLAGRLMNVSEIMINCMTEPDMVRITMEKTTEFLINYIKAYRAVGANGVVLAEPLTGMLSPTLAAEFSAPYVKKIADAVKSDDFIIIYHNCGDNTVLMTESILSTGCDCYHFGNAIKIEEILEKMPSDTMVMGNVDPAGLFLNGTPESMRETVLSIMEKCCDKHPNFIVSSGCDIPPMSGWDNIDAFFSAVAEFYKKRA